MLDPNSQGGWQGVLGQCSSLQKLNLEANGIGSDGVMDLLKTLLKRAGNRARGKTAGKRVKRKTKLLTNAGTTAEVQGEVVGSLSQVLGDGSHRVSNWISDDIASYRKQR